MLTSHPLATPLHYQLKAVHESHGWRVLLPYRYDSTTDTLSRLERLPDGQAVLLQMMQTATGIVLQVDTPLSESNWAILADRMGHALDLHADLSEFYTVLEQVPRLAWVASQGAGRMLKSPTVWEDLVKTLLY